MSGRGYTHQEPSLLTLTLRLSVSLLPPAGGFSHQYWCACDQLGVAYREEVQWVGPPPPALLLASVTADRLTDCEWTVSVLLLQDVDTIYLSQDTRELNLQDFIHLENR